MLLLLFEAKRLCPDPEPQEERLAQDDDEDDEKDECEDDPPENPRCAPHPEPEADPAFDHPRGEEERPLWAKVDDGPELRPWSQLEAPCGSERGGGLFARHREDMMAFW